MVLLWDCNYLTVALCDRCSAENLIWGKVTDMESVYRADHFSALDGENVTCA